MDSPWDALALKMDLVVDDRLGDRVSYSIAGGPFNPLPAFLVPYEDNLQLADEVDELLGSRLRVKIAKRLVAQPGQGDRIRHPRLGVGDFVPAGATDDTDGRYWLFDVQAA